MLRTYVDRHCFKCKSHFKSKRHMHYCMECWVIVLLELNINNPPSSIETMLKHVEKFGYEEFNRDVITKKLIIGSL